MNNFKLVYGAFNYEIEDVEDDQTHSFVVAAMYMKHPELENNCKIDEDTIFENGKSWIVLTFVKKESTNN